MVHSHNRLFYDQGWNDCVDGKPLIKPCSIHYRDGWLDCASLDIKDRNYFPDATNQYPNYDEAKL